jgi:hypothetical protein
MDVPRNPSEITAYALAKAWEYAELAETAVTPEGMPGPDPTRPQNLATISTAWATIALVGVEWGHLSTT